MPDPIIIKDWNELQEEYRKFPKQPRWLFRGMRSAEWNLKPSLERSLERFDISLIEMEKFEDRMLREFKRRFHLYSRHLPAENDRGEWLALMQHHGAPTRLLDWTYSFHVALFFAIEKASKNEVCAIWAVNHDYCRKRIDEMLEKKLPKVSKKLKKNDKNPKALWKILTSKESLLCPLNPMRLNERLAAQQGVFLAAANITVPFQKIFDEAELAGQESFRKIHVKCSKDFLVEALGELQRMNISRISLFPGLDGFAPSLENRIPLEHLWTYVP